jgi:uncharacterized Tic20 family protein
MSSSVVTQEEKVMSAIAHGSVILFGTGLIAAIVVWITQKDKSRYVAFQALQAVIYQAAGLLVFGLAMCCWLGLYFLSFIPLMVAADQGSSDPPAFFIFSMLLMVVPFAVMGLWVLGGIWGAIRALQGRDFGYLVIGDQLERWQAEG